MSDPGRRMDHRGNVLFLVLAVMSIIFIAVFALSFMTRSDASSTSNLLRELLGTQLAESIATQVEAQVNTKPWSRRFWLIEAQKAGTYVEGTGVVPTYTINKGSPYINLSLDSMPASEYDFVGVVKDCVDPEAEVPPQDYRIYLEVTMQGYTYAFTWDKRWSQSIMVGLNRDTTLVDKALGDLESAPTATDSLVDNIKIDVLAAPQADGSGAAQTSLISKLRRDAQSHRAQAILGEPVSNPGLLPPK